MPEVHLLEELLIVLALTVSIVYLFQKIRVPASLSAASGAYE
jgi:Kef-type K+ transport system membrane component KefB